LSAQPTRLIVTILETAKAVERAQNAHAHREDQRPMLYQHDTDGIRVGLNLAIARGLLWLHESGTLCEIHAVGCPNCSPRNWNGNLRTGLSDGRRASPVSG